MSKAWQKKMEIDGRRLYFDNDCAAEAIVRGIKPIKAVLKEKEDASAVDLQTADLC